MSLKAFASAVAKIPKKVHDKMKGKTSEVQGPPHVAWLSEPRCPACQTLLGHLGNQWSSRGQWSSTYVICACGVRLYVECEVHERYRSTLSPEE